MKNAEKKHIKDLVTIHTDHNVFAPDGEKKTIGGDKTIKYADYENGLYLIGVGEENSADQYKIVEISYKRNGKYEVPEMLSFIDGLSMNSSYDDLCSMIGKSEQENDYRTYVQYLWNQDDYVLNVLFQKNKMIQFSLIDLNGLLEY